LSQMLRNRNKAFRKAMQALHKTRAKTSRLAILKTEA
jgi:hypothetical protein